MHKYKNLNTEFKIIKEFDFLDVPLILVKEKTKYKVFEKTSGIILINNVPKEKIKDLELLKQKIFYQLDALIFFNGIEFIFSQIEKQKKLSGELIKL